MKLRKRFWLGLLLLLIISALLLLPDIRWRITGWMKGEAFYQGRPTSYWADDIERHVLFPTPGSSGIVGQTGSSDSDFNFLTRWFTWDSTATKTIVVSIPTPPLLTGDINAMPVLVELAKSGNPRTRRIAIYGLCQIGPDARQAVIDALQVSPPLDSWTEMKARKWLEQQKH